MSERILLTGATGRVGRWSCKKLLARGHNVILFTRNEPSLKEKYSKDKIDILQHLKSKRVIVVQGDLGQEQDVAKAFFLNDKQYQPDRVLFAAGGDNADYNDVNYLGVKYCAEHATKINCKGIVVISCAWVTKPYSLLALIVNIFYPGYPMALHLKGENCVRSSGIPYVIARPGALVETNDVKGVVFSQGDTMGFIEGGRPGLAIEPLAETMVQTLWAVDDLDTSNEETNCGLTFEMTSSNSNTAASIPHDLIADPPYDYKSGFNALQQDSKFVLGQDDVLIKEHRIAVRKVKLYGSIACLGIVAVILGILFDVSGLISMAKIK
eukprot:365314_1